MAYTYGEKRRASDDLHSFVHRLTNLHLAIPLMFVMIFLWLNGTYLWGAYWESTTALAYIIMFAFVIAMTRNSSLVWLTKMSLSDGMLSFWMGFIVMFAGLIVANQFVLQNSLTPSTAIVSSAVYPAIALHAIFVAPVEETTFRGVLKERMKGWMLYSIPLGIIITSGLFAITHFAVYRGQIMSIWWAFLMGGVFYLFTNFKPLKSRGPLGVPGAIGAHTCYNLFVLGILSGVIL